MRTIGQGKKKYVLQSIIGQGSFGKVYHSPPYAIKELTISTHKHVFNAIKNETSILKKLDHPHIVKLYDIVEENNSLFMVMQKCEMDLSQYLKKYKIDELRATDIIKQIIGGLSYLVSKGIIHRDIKPANILVNSRNQFKLADFGLARHVQEFDNSLLQTIAGTPLYMAPQILKKTSYTTKCDIWSTGIIFYELFVGRPPWEAANEQELIYNITKKPLKIPAHLSDWGKNLLTKMIVVNENERIGWDQLFDLVRWYNPPVARSIFNITQDKSRSRQRPQTARSETNIERSPAKVAKEYLNYPSAKLEQLLRIDLLQHFDEQTINKILKDSSYNLASEEYSKVKEVLSCYNEQLKAWFLKEYPNFRCD